MTDIKLGDLHHLATGEHSLAMVHWGPGTPGLGRKLFIDAIVLEPAGIFMERATE